MTPFIIKANTPEDMRDQIVQWLRDQAINHGVATRIAERAYIQTEHRHKSAAYTSAADFIQLIKIEPKQPIPTMIKLCPRCVQHPIDGNFLGTIVEGNICSHCWLEDRNTE